MGAGWNVEEMANHGTEFKSRLRLMRERVEAMKAIWTHEEAALLTHYYAGLRTKPLLHKRI